MKLEGAQRARRQKSVEVMHPVEEQVAIWDPRDVDEFVRLVEEDEWADIITMIAVLKVIAPERIPPHKLDQLLNQAEVKYRKGVASVERQDKESGTKDFFNALEDFMVLDHTRLKGRNDIGAALMLTRIVEGGAQRLKDLPPTILEQLVFSNPEYMRQLVNQEVFEHLKSGVESAKALEVSGLLEAVRNLAIVRMLFPDQFSSVPFSALDMSLAHQQLVELRKQEASSDSGLQEYPLYLLSMMIVSADEFSISTDQGIKMQFSPSAYKSKGLPDRSLVA